MATVTGYTAQRMKQIEDETVVSGSVVVDNLILKTRAGQTINAGNVRGPVAEQQFASPAVTLPPSGYPSGLSVSSATSSGWPSAYVTLLTVRRSATRTFQLATNKTTAQMWMRAETDGDLWGDFTSVLADSVPWGSITGKPTTFPPSTHGHALTDSNMTGVLPVAQVPTLDINSKTSGTLALATGGTGATTAAAARTALGVPPIVHGHALTDSNMTGVLPAAQIPAASDTARGGVERATQAEVNTGTDTSRYITPKLLRDSTNLPYATARGSVSCAATGVTTVTFPSGRFNRAPIVIASPSGNGTVGMAHIGTRTSTTVEMRFFSFSGAQMVGTIHWEASLATSGSATG